MTPKNAAKAIGPEPDSRPDPVVLGVAGQVSLTGADRGIGLLEAIGVQGFGAAGHQLQPGRKIGSLLHGPPLLRTANTIGVHVRPHDLRRFAATYASRSGVPIEIVSKVILRHSNLATTQIYLGRVSDEEAFK